MRTLLVILTRLSADPSVPLFGEKPYAYGEGEAAHPKYKSVAFGQGGADAGCAECMDPPPSGKWFIYDDPTWTFTADEPRKPHD